MEDVIVPPSTTTNSNDSELGTALAQLSLLDLSTSNTTVSTPTAALASVLHAALRSSMLGFNCMGIPEEQHCFKNKHNEKKSKKKKTSGGGGFAAPVRELPRGVFLPNKWDRNASSSSSDSSAKDTTRDCCHGVSLRYSKCGMPSTALRVAETKLEEDVVTTTTGISKATTMMKVCFGPLGGEPAILTFPVEQHFNLDGFSAALSLVPPSTNHGVKPALYFKALATLLANFCTVADVGRVDVVLLESSDVVTNEDNNSVAQKMKSVRNVEPPPPPSLGTTTFVRHPPPPPFEKTTLMEGVRPPTIQNDLLGVTHRSTATSRGGDFGDDLEIRGHLPLVPGMPSVDGITGSLMGPNHPNFHNRRSNNYYEDEDDDCMGYPGNGGGSGGFVAPGGVGGLGMQPRFDPFYPPGVGLLI